MRKKAKKRAERLDKKAWKEYNKSDIIRPNRKKFGENKRRETL